MNPWSTPVAIGPLVPLKYAARIVNEKRDVAPGEDYLGLDRVEPWTGRLLEETETPEATGMGVCFRKGDVLFGKLRPYLAKVLHAEADGIASTEFLVLREREVWSRFLSYILRTPSVISAVNATTYGAKMPRASWDDVGRLLVPVPTGAQQHEIADFLDRETARIDALGSGLIARARR